MRKLLISVIFLLFSFSLVKTQTVKAEPNQSVEKSSAKSIVRGRIVYEDSGLPLRRGLIGLLSIKDNLDSDVFKSFSYSDINLYEFVLTNDDGEFEIKNVKAGDYYPFINVPNVLNPQSVNKFYGRNNTLALTKFESFFPKIVVDGISGTNVLISAKRGAAVSGKLLFADGSPAIKFKVEIFRKGKDVWNEEPINVQEDYTDDRGFYRFTELLPGEYFIKVIEPSDHKKNGKADEFRSYLTGSQLNIFYPDAAGMKQAKSIEVNWGREQTDIDFTIPNRKLYKISGVVIAKDSQESLPDATVRFQKFDEANGSDYYTEDTNRIYSDGEGNWNFKDLPQGTYRIEVSPPADKSKQSEKSKYARYVKEVKIENEDITNISIELPLESSISGKLKLESEKTSPFSAQLYLFDKKNNVKAHEYLYSQNREDSAPKSEQEFRISGLSKGSYLFNVYVDGDYYVKSVKINSTDLASEILEIGEGQEIKSIEIILADDVGTIKGKVFKSQNTPAKFIPVLLIPTDSNKQKKSNFHFSTFIGATGEFQIKVAPGEYFVTFPSFEDTKLTKENWLKKLTKNSNTVSVKSKETQTISVILSKTN